MKTCDLCVSVLHAGASRLFVSNVCGRVNIPHVLLGVHGYIYGERGTRSVTVSEPHSDAAVLTVGAK
jgi:hypothetical protein